VVKNNVVGQISWLHYCWKRFPNVRPGNKENEYYHWIIYRHSIQIYYVNQGCPTRGPHAAREVVLSGPPYNKFVSRLFHVLVFFYRLKYICHKNTPKLYLLFLLWAYHPKTCITNALKICQFFRFGLHPYKLATLSATTL